jgi:hypothetical protein
MTARLVRRNRTIKHRARVAVATLCTGAAIAFSWGETEALARAVGWVYQHRLAGGCIAAVASAVLVARRRVLKRAEYAKSWLAAVPVRSATARWETLAIETLPATATIAALTVMAAISAAALALLPHAPGLPLWVTWAYLILGLAFGVLMSYFIPAPKAVDLPPGSRYVPHTPTKRAAQIQPSLRSLQFWPVRQVFAWLQPKMVARATIPILVMMPMGTTADTGLVVIAMFGVAGALMLCCSAAIAVSRLARSWLSSLPMRDGAAVRALLNPAIAIILAASIIEALLLLVLGVTYRTSAAVALCAAAVGCLATIAGVHLGRSKRTP